MPLKPGKPDVRLYNGSLKSNQAAHHAVLDIDTGTRNLQQCADAVIRLRAEYLYSNKKYDSIHFDFTDRVPARFDLWSKGYRPIIKQKSKTKWIKTAKYDRSYHSFRKYLISVYSYAGTYSLARETKKIKLKQLRAGDFFIQGGFPGHAVLIVDVVVNKNTRKKRFLLAQSYMPAQDMHILNNPSQSSPWYEVPSSNIITPEWTFKKSDLQRFTR